MKQLNILQVINVRFYNATAWYALYLSKTLCALGHNSTVLTLENTLCDKKAQELDIPRIALPFDQKKLKNFPSIYAYIDKELARLQPDIVNCHRGELYPLFVFFRNKYGYKLVRTRGDQRPIKTNGINKLLYSKKSDALIATNSRIYKQLVDVLHVNKNKVFTIFGGVDTKAFYNDKSQREKTRALYNYTSNDCVLGLLGRLDPIKGQKESILALSKLVHEYKIQNVKLCIIGFDDLYLKSSEIYPLIEEHNLQDYVQITGKVQNVNEVLNMCDFGWLSSIGSEAIARAAFEFMACDVPLFSSEIGVMPDITIEKARFKTADIDSMAQCMANISKAYDEKDNSELAIQTRKNIEEIKLSQQEFIKTIDLEKFANKSLKVYTSLLENHE